MLLRVGLFVAMLVLLVGSAQSASPTKQRVGTVRVVSLSGSYHEMGTQYGKMLQSDLNQALTLLKRFYVTDHHLPYALVISRATQLYNRFPSEYQAFIQGVSEGAEISLDDAKVLNGMETLTDLIPSQTPRCAYLYVPANQTVSGATLVGRNYDYPPPFDELSQFLTVTVMHAPNKIPTAFISLVGEIYCPTCVNAKGVFMELNNGMPSGGYEVNEHVSSLLSTMLLISEEADSVNAVKNLLLKVPADFSLIINVADRKSMATFEFSTIQGMHHIMPNTALPFVSTNFYLSSAWQDIPKPTDEMTWFGVTRRDNLLNLVHQSPLMDVYQLQALMDKNMMQGGAVWPVTIYQLIYDASMMSLYVKVNNHQTDWVKIDLKKVM